MTRTLNGDLLPKKQREASILFVYTDLSTFVLDDLKILQKHFTVRPLNVTTFLVPRKAKHWIAYFKLFKEVLRADVVYSRWADLNAFFAVLFSAPLRKKSVVVIGGYEVANVPQINYGTLLSSAGRFEVKFILRHASKILAVSESSKKGILRFAKPKSLQLVYNGIDTEKFLPLGEKERSVITVVRKISPETAEIKRLDTFLKASVYLPDVKFVLVGEITGGFEAALKKIGGVNVEFTGYLSPEALLPYYRKAKVYCQISTHESFGVALAEAMSCGCVPVVTSRFALPEIVGDAGFYVPYGDPQATAETIKKALVSNRGLKARARIEKYFSLKSRERDLIGEISDTVRR